MHDLKAKRILLESGQGTQKISISAVIPTIKERVETLQSLKNASNELSLDIEVIMVMDRGPRLEHKAARGRMRNEGAMMAGGDIVVFVDDDILFQPSDLSKALTILSRTRKAITGGVYIEPWARLPTIGTRFLALKRSDFSHIGGFDERLCAYEDWEFTTRALIKGYKLVNCAPSVTHKHRRNFRQLLFRNLMREIYGTRAVIMHAKHFRRRMLRWFFPLFIRDPALSNDLWKNAITRSGIRILAFHYLKAKRISQLAASSILRWLESL